MRVVVVMVLLLLLEFYLRPALVEIHHGAPDFMMLVLLLLAIRRSPGVAAVIGLIIGLVIDVLTPAHFGAGILASVLVGWGAAWGRSLFFADNLMVNAALFFIGTWVRDVLLLVFSGTPLKAMPDRGARLGAAAVAVDGGRGRGSGDRLPRLARDPDRSMSPFTSWRVARRAVVIQWIFLAAFVVLGGAFFKAQVLDHDLYRTESARTHLRPIPLEAPRGDILDRNGEPIAENFTGYSVKLLATNEDSLRAVLARLDALIPNDTIDAEAVVQRWQAARYQPALVYASGRYNLVATLEEHRAALPGLVIQREPRRRYPDSSAVAHMVGYVGEVSSTEIDNNAFPGARPGEIVGKQGLEFEYDSILRGTRGIRFVDVAANGRTISNQPEAGSLSPVPGNLIHTTIDMGLQRFIDSMWRADLGERRGAMVAMTPQGEILAYYSHPSFDPNDFIGGIDHDTWAALNDDPNRPLYNRVIQAAYPPASPFKLAMAAMALRRGLVDMDTQDAGAVHRQLSVRQPDLALLESARARPALAAPGHRVVVRRVLLPARPDARRPTRCWPTRPTWASANAPASTSPANGRASCSRA